MRFSGTAASSLGVSKVRLLLVSSDGQKETRSGPAAGRRLTVAAVSEA